MLARRLEDIYKLLEQNGSVRVPELSKFFGVAEKTIRQDLIRLESLNMAKRVHGGAVLATSENRYYTMISKKQTNIDRKKKIAAAAYNLLSDGDSIFLDSGTTTIELAKLIQKQVVVITNDPIIASELLTHESVTLYVTGGRLKREFGTYTYVGQDAIRTIQKYNANKMFLAASAFNFEQGFMVYSAEEMETKRAMIKSSQKRIAMIDYSKFNKIGLSSFASLDEVEEFITDDTISEEDKKRIIACGMKLIIA